MRFGRYDEVKQGLIRYNACNGIKMTYDGVR